MKKTKLICAIAILPPMILSVITHNWMCLLWQTLSAVLLFLSIDNLVLIDRQRKANQLLTEEMRQRVKEMTDHSIWKRMVKAKAKSECYLANCKRALENMLRMKEQLNTLKILNKNLIDELYKKKSHAKHTNR